MMRRVLMTALAVTCLTACAAEPEQAPAQTAAPAATEAPADPWEVRIDKSASATDPDNTPDIEFNQMGTNGFHYVGGPAGTLWMPAGPTASGAYTLSATFTQNGLAGHPSFYGLVFGGSNLGDATERYLYFQVAENGTFLIKERTGEDTTELEGGEMKNDAIRVSSEGGSAENMLEVRVTADTVSFVVNGTVVHITPRMGPFAMTDGVVGARVNHVLDVTVSNFQLQ
jgi:hypothetical protein